MELATMSKVLGRFLFALFAGLVPATQPFSAPRDRAAVALPAGVYARKSGAPNQAGGDAVTIERGEKGGYRVVCAFWNERPVEFDAELFAAGKDREGATAYFLDMRPRAPHPEKRGLPAGATHLAARVSWRETRDGVWLDFEPADKAWLDERKPAMGMSTPELRELLRQALAAGAFGDPIQLYRKHAL